MKLKCIFDNKEIIILIKDGDEVINIGNLNDNNILTVNYVIQPDKSSYQLSYIFEKSFISFISKSKNSSKRPAVCNEPSAMF